MLYANLSLLHERKIKQEENIQRVIHHLIGKIISLLSCNFDTPYMIVKIFLAFEIIMFKLLMIHHHLYFWLGLRAFVLIIAKLYPLNNFNT